MICQFLGTSVSIAEEVRPSVEETHRRLWPGWDVPPFAISKSTVLKRREQQQEQQQAWWLPVAAMPTSIFISFLVWGMSHWKRAIKDRMPVARRFKQVIQVLACGVHKLTLMIHALGNTDWEEVELDSTLLLEGSDLWPQNPFHHRMLRSAWDQYFHQDESPISSSFERPHLADFLIFALEPTNGIQRQCLDLAPTALCIITQLAGLLDENPGGAAKSIVGLPASKGKRSKLDWRLQGIGHAEEVAKRLWFKKPVQPDADAWLAKSLRWVGQGEPQDNSSYYRKARFSGCSANYPTYQPRDNPSIKLY